MIIYVKVKWSRYRPGLAQRVGKGIALLFHDRGNRRRWVVSSTPRPYFTLGNYIWLNQLSNTTNLWWIDVYYLVINYMFRRLWPSLGWWINKNTHKQLHLHASPGKYPVPIVQEAGWAPGLVWTGGKYRPHRNSILDRPVRNQSLYRLSYPALWLFVYSTGYAFYTRFNRETLYINTTGNPLGRHSTIRLIAIGPGL